MQRRRRVAALLALGLVGGACRIESRRMVDSADDARAVAAAVRECGPAVIDSGGVGELRVGASIDSVQAMCAVARDTTRLGADGMPARMLSVVVGSDTVDARIVNGRVWRIEVTRPGPRTSDSLGVGDPLAKVLAIPGVRGAVGEGPLFALSPERCGLSFQLSGSHVRADGWTAERLRRLKPPPVVTRVLIFGCRTSANAP